MFDKQLQKIPEKVALSPTNKAASTGVSPRLGRGQVGGGKRASKAPGRSLSVRSAAGADGLG